MTDAAVLAKSGEAVKAGPIGLAVILLLCIACYFLFKSMSKHMREVRENFPTGEPTAPAPTAPTGVQRAELIKTEPATGHVPDGDAQPPISGDAQPSISGDAQPSTSGDAQPSTSGESQGPATSSE